MKSKVVIFSSSENLEIARDFASELRKDAECTVWRDLEFALSDFLIKDLVAFGKEYDFALLIFGYEDKVVIKGKEYSATRDNVIFELGLMSGLIGSNRCFIVECVSKFKPNRRLPSDIEGITRVLFDTDCDDRDNELHVCVKPIKRAMKKRGQKEYVSQELISQFSIAGITAFYTNRNDISILRRSDEGTLLPELRDYLSIAKNSIKIVAFSFLRAAIFVRVRPIFEEKLRSSPNFSITISLLNYKDSSYYSSCRLTHGETDNKRLIDDSVNSIKELCDFRESLSDDLKERFHIKIHNTALFEAAVLIDDDKDYGRIQIEIKPYKKSVQDAFSFEIKKSNDNPQFYEKIRESYNTLLNESTDFDKFKQ